VNANYKSIISAISLYFALSASISAAPGDLDPTFGNGGIVITRDSSQHSFDYASGMAIQSDGKIVVVGEGSAGSGNWDFAAVRYHTDGSLDTSFGSSGIVITPLTFAYDGARSVAIQASGKIVVAGCVFAGPGSSSFGVVRYSPNGTLDASFNGTGKVITSVDNLRGCATSVAIQSDSKIVVAGSSGNGLNSDFAVVRYNTDGSLDATFNGTGKVITHSGGGAISVAIQSDAKIIAAGGSQNGFTLVRYHTDGTLDTSFNGTGKVTTQIGNTSSVAYSVVVQSDGKIVAAGSSHDGLSQLNFTLVRYNADGSLDPTFNGSGKVVTPVGSSNSEARSVAIQGDGKIIVAGQSSDSTGTGSDFAVVRYNKNGSLDTTFNGTGKVITSIDLRDLVSAAAIQPDGKIVVAGFADDGSDFFDYVVVRYQGDAPPSACPNLIDCSESFVRQHYLDFLDREPDAGGLAYWSNEIAQCLSDAICINARRVGVSAAFFIEQEFQETGYYVYRFYKASFGRQPNYSEFTTDRSRIIPGANLEASKQTFADEWVQRPAFVAAYPMTMSNTEFVNKLFDFAGLIVSRYDSLRQQEISAMNTGRSRALILRDVIEIPDFRNIPDPDDPRYSELKQASQYNPAFVLMQYFGYLRRDVDSAGFAFWLDIVNNREPNNYRAMVCAFITSREYQQRFGSEVTRTNADCGE
jgi:uncharacterized delta-60 repeat protein